MLLQLETHPISQEQLANKVKGIYAGLVMVEKKCVEIGRLAPISLRQMPNDSSNLPQAINDTMRNMTKRRTDEDGKSTPENGARPNKLQAHTSYYDTARDEQHAGTQNPVAESPNRRTSTFQPSLTKARSGSTNPEMQIPGSTSPPSSPVFNTTTERDFTMLLQPETRPITQEQLVNEVNEIYAKLIIVEKKCVEIDQQQALTTTKLSDTVPKGGLRMQRLKRFLPMFLNGSRYNTTPDTGSLENALSADEARRLGLKITGRGRQFLMGNGSTTISRGIVRLKCAFALGERCLTRQSFHVIDNLVVPVIIGKKFLDISETMTSNQHRLEAVWISAKKAFRVMHLNRPRQLVRCYVNGKLVHANPDSGSEVDLMSPFYARENMLKIEALEEGEDWVQFADGSTAKLLGKTHVDLDLYDGHYKSATGYRGRSRTFYLLDGLRTDILLGEEVLYDMDVFTEHEDSFVDSDDCGLSVEMNLITWFDKRTRQMSDTLSVLSSARSKQSKSPL